MAVMSAYDSSLYIGRLEAHVGWLGLRVGRLLAPSLHSSNDRVDSCIGRAVITAR